MRPAGPHPSAYDAYIHILRQSLTMMKHLFSPISSSVDYRRQPSNQIKPLPPSQRRTRVTGDRETLGRWMFRLQKVSSRDKVDRA